MADPVTALVVALTAFLTAMTGYVRTLNSREKKNRKALDAAFPKIRALETRVAALEGKDALPPLPTCLIDCQRKEA
jgi:hypothetical protein